MIFVVKNEKYDVWRKMLEYIYSEWRPFSDLAADLLILAKNMDYNSLIGEFLNYCSNNTYLLQYL